MQFSPPSPFFFSSPLSARWHQQGVRLHRKSSREQLHGTDVSKIFRLVRWIHQKREAEERAQDPRKPARRAFHEEVPKGASGDTETFQVHNSHQED